MKGSLISVGLDELETSKSVPGLFEYTLTHKVAKTTGIIHYTGPKIPHDVWEETLAFFKWVFDTYKSEAQVRMYVNQQRNTWASWAFPQEARYGLSTKEVEGEEFNIQREMFPRRDGWLYFATAHHHCDISAFQSTTDEDNEKNQDGIHLTVGHMDRSHYDLHARVHSEYAKACFDPDMSEFWEIGDIKNQIPSDLFDQVARWQMGIPPQNQDFPEIWRDNVRRPASLVRAKSDSAMEDWRVAPDGWYGHDYVHSFGTGPTLGKTDIERANDVLDELLEHALIGHSPERQDELVEIVDLMSDSAVGTLVQRLIEREGITFKDLQSAIQSRA